jgi:hypothetical protein
MAGNKTKQRGEKMSWNKPEWYLTTEEFAELVVESLEVTHHFERDEKVHPEDIVAAFVTAAESIAIGAGAVGKKVWAAEKKAVMETGNLSKHGNSAFTKEYGSLKDYAPTQERGAAPVAEDELGYSEYRHKNAYM